jgi:hypothetical protein
VTSTPLDLRLGDVLRLRKPHACGGNDWTVTRLGADIGLRCNGCGHRILLARSLLARRITEFVERAPDVSLPEQLNLP